MVRNSLENLGHYLVLNASTGESFEVNITGKKILDSCNGSLTRDEIAKKVDINNHDIKGSNERTLIKDIIQYVEVLLEEKILEEIEDDNDITTLEFNRNKAIHGRGENSGWESLRCVCEHNANEHFHFQWHITDRCNLRCKHCYIVSHNSNELSIEEIINIVDHLADVLKLWGYVGSISITGGEPFIRSDFRDIVNSIKKHEQFESILVMTNGTLISDDVIEFLVETGCSVQVSIDGLTKGKHDEIRGEGNFDKTLSTLKRLSVAGVYTSVHFVVHKSNYPTDTSQLEYFLNLLQIIGVKETTFSRLVPIGRGIQMRELLLSPEEVRILFQRLIKVQERFPALIINTSRPLWAALKDGEGGECPVGFGACTILPNGEVLPCRRLPIVLGNLRDQSFYEIWYKSDILWRLRKREEIEVCGKCKFLGQCAGCRAIAYAVYGDYMARDPQCFIPNDETGKTSRLSV